MPALATTVAGTFLAINCQPLELESCSNYLLIWQVFCVVSKRFFDLGLGFSVGDVTMRACFCIIDQLYLAEPFFGKLGDHLHL